MKLLDKIFLILITWLAFAILTHGQPIPDPVVLEAANESQTLVNQDLTLLNDEVFLQQAGISNKAVIIQFSPMDLSNSAHVVQFGQFSDIQLSQLGAANLVEFYQDGLSNDINVSEKGDFISSRIQQFGSFNSVFQELGSDRTDHLIIQKGYNHKVTDTGYNPNSPGYTIKQEGMVGMSLIIEHH